MKGIIGLLVTAALLVGCGAGQGQAEAGPETPGPGHRWLEDPDVQVPPDSLAEARVLGAIRDLARETGIGSRDLIVEFQGTTRRVPDGPKAGFRALSFTVRVFGERAAVEAFVGRLDEGEPYHTLVVYGRDLSVNGEASASVEFNVYTFPAP